MLMSLRCCRFPLALKGMRTFANDEATRTFVALKSESGSNKVQYTLLVQKGKGGKISESWVLLVMDRFVNLWKQSTILFSHLACKSSTRYAWILLKLESNGLAAWVWGQQTMLLLTYLNGPPGTKSAHFDCFHSGRREKYPRSDSQQAKPRHSIPVWYTDRGTGKFWP